VINTTHGQDSLADTVTDIPLSGPVARIPEYHDCQRFIEGDQYTALFAIFAAFRLDTVDTLSGPVDTMPMATIYTPSGDYPALGIKPGFNCLFLSRNTSHVWTAKVIPWGIDKNNCADGHIVPGPGVGTDLSVRQQAVSGTFSARDYPPAARWDRDGHDSVYTIGIRCGRAWCEVGRRGFTPSVGYNGPALSFDPIGGVMPSAQAQARVQRIKGWYDVQRLADPSTGSLHPTKFRGFLIPHPLLDSVAWLNWKTDPTAALESYFRQGWLHVGYAYMEGNYSKWNFRQGINKIYMCYGTLGGNCELPQPLPQAEKPSTVTLENCPTDPTTPSRRWWARTTSAGGTTYVCIERMDHRNDLLAWAQDPHNAGVLISIPATARWRFLPRDESGWWGCPSGCCTKM